MANMYIGTNEQEIWFGDWSYVMRQPNTRYCVEQVSDEMFNAMIKFAQDDQHKETISYLLYDILEEKWIHNN